MFENELEAVFPASILQFMVVPLKNLNQRGVPTASTRVKVIDIKPKQGVDVKLRIRPQHAKLMYFHGGISEVYQTSPFVYRFIQVSHNSSLQNTGCVAEI